MTTTPTVEDLIEATESDAVIEEIIDQFFASLEFRDWVADARAFHAQLLLATTEVEEGGLLAIPPVDLATHAAEHADALAKHRATRRPTFDIKALKKRLLTKILEGMVEKVTASPTPRGEA